MAYCTIEVILSGPREHHFISQKGERYEIHAGQGSSVIQSSACLRRTSHHVRLDLLGFPSPLMCALDGYTTHCIRKSRPFRYYSDIRFD